MARAVKSDDGGRRDYNSPRRREQARATRLAVLTAAREMFLAGGYHATTIPSVAAAAGVSVETVYKAFGNKAGLVKTLYDVAIVGDDEPVPLMQREFVQRNMAEPDPVRKLVDYGVHVAEVASRVSPVLLVIRDAAATDAGAADVWSQAQQERLTGMTFFARHLADGGHLRDDVGEDEARDVLWTYNSVEIWDLLVRQRGWSRARHAAWVGRQLVAALLPTTQSPGG